ncbi:MAG: hypothetical protein OEM96_03615 [Gemmatimonadota bacterium]|nr:hypothetical protein [Gemmatimonadota bacterium]
MTWLFVLSMLVVAAPGRAPSPAVHPQHLSTGQLAVEERVAYLRVRMYMHDLEAALAAAHGLDSIRLEPTPAKDSLFLAYFVERYEVQLNGQQIRPDLISSGEDVETGESEERVWWVLLRYRSTGRIGALAVRARILFEWFEDQRNVVRVLHADSGQQETIYFAAPDADWAELTFP